MLALRRRKKSQANGLSSREPSAFLSFFTLSRINLQFYVNLRISVSEGHSVGFRDATYGAAGVAEGERVGRDVFGDDASGADYCIVSYRDAR